MKSWLPRLPAFLLTALVASCGGGGGDGGGGGGTPPPAALSGTWLGTHEDIDLFLSTASVTISGGSIDPVMRDGFNTGLTGTVTQQAPDVMRYTLTGGAEPLTGIFLVHADTHLTFADDGGNVGVLQKNAGSLPSYNETDLVGAWTGVAMQTDFSGFFNQASASASCTFTTALNCTLTDPSGTFNAAFSAFDFRGRWMGTFTGPTTGNANAFMSADKTFLAVWACDDPDQLWPQDCAFYALHR